MIQTMAGAFASEGRTVRLSLIMTDGAVEALALLGAGGADLAIGRGDLEMPADAQAVAIVRKNVVVLWAPSGLASKSSKRKPELKINEIADLAGHRVGVIGRTPANAALLQVILSASGVGRTRSPLRSLARTKLRIWRATRPSMPSWQSVRSTAK